MEGLRGYRLLVVEDDYLMASELVYALEELGAAVAGPAGSVAEALALVEGDGRLDGAVLDVNLGGERVFPVADALMARGVPFVFATGYDSWVVPAAYAGVPRCEKPITTGALARALIEQIEQ